MASITEGTCPSCGADMQGAPIPEEHRHNYCPLDTPPEKVSEVAPAHYSRLIGVEYAYGSPNRYDGVSEWLCPDCGYREGRWTGRELAEGESEPRFGGAK